MLPNWLYGKSKSKLANILGGGGGTPTDYNQVKAQVTQNTEDILSLSNALDDKAALTQITNPNLLDNPWFTVNQRGETSSYFADRWVRYASELTFTNNNGVTISGTPSSVENLGTQKIEWDRLKDDIGKAITLSVLIDGTVYKAVGKIETPISSWKGHVNLDIPSLNIAFRLLTNDASPSSAQLLLKNINTDAINVTIRAIKLELGSVSTLAMDAAPNYQQELAKCQRYFQRIGKTYQNPAGKTLGISSAFATDNMWVPIYLPVPLRATPTININGKFGVTESSTSEALITTDNGLNILISNFDETDISLINLQLTNTNSNYIVGKFYKLITFAGDTAVATIDLSADL